MWFHELKIRRPESKNKLGRDLRLIFNYMSSTSSRWSQTITFRLSQSQPTRLNILHRFPLQLPMTILAELGMVTEDLEPGSLRVAPLLVELVVVPLLVELGADRALEHPVV